ncbi:hypothetical protein N7481_007429 [Penicillium waksmanii]|uniref:uncharacterized protein n=1 Tax=Penicillium waksmanii TaxID=69791 RepID=UPI002549B592|nr:uncharacterized protein N7481_007429 [Penicillium waksmanii]KAJ5980131.1 hypothetical protein N7481_007429 [Penicillium waksmanii]
MTATGPSNFGPLTTIFSPPAWCSNERWIAHDSTQGGTLLRWGATCESGTIGFASECYPTGWTGSNASALSYKGFSPGLACPSGFTGAASASHIEQSDHFVLSEYITDLGQHDLATACCPKNYDYNGHMCVSHTLSFDSAHPFLTTSGSKCIQTTSFKYFQSIGSSASSGQATFQAYPVIIVQDSRSSTSIPQPTGSKNSNGSSNSGALSTGAKIAIGVCIPMVIIIIAALAFIWWHRRRARAKKDAAAVAAAADEGVTSSQKDPYAGKPELDGETQVDPYKSQNREWELDAAGIVVPPVELSALQGNVLTEMPSEKSPDTPQAELPGDFGAFGTEGKTGDDDASKNETKDGNGNGRHSPAQDK